MEQVAKQLSEDVTVTRDLLRELITTLEEHLTRGKRRTSQKKIACGLDLLARANFVLRKGKATRSSTKK